MSENEENVKSSLFVSKKKIVEKKFEYFYDDSDEHFILVSNFNKEDVLYLIKKKKAVDETKDYKIMIGNISFIKPNYQLNNDILQKSIDFRHDGRQYVNMNKYKENVVKFLLLEIVDGEGMTVYKRKQIKDNYNIKELENLNYSELDNLEPDIGEICYNIISDSL